MPQHSETFPHGWLPRHRAASASPETFVPIRSVVDAVRRIRENLEREARVVVVYGPHGSGRSTIARRVASLWKGPVSFLLQPPGECDPGVLFADDAHKLLRGNSRGEVLRVIDALSLEHAGWSGCIAENLPPGQKVLIVASTAWWLEFGRYLPVRVAGIATKWLEADEIAHLINGLRWMRYPNSPAAEPDYVAQVAAATEGRLSEIVRMAGVGSDRLR